MSKPTTILDVPAPVYAALRALLDAAKCEHAARDHEGGELLSLRNVGALRSRGGTAVADITVASLLSNRTKEGRVEFSLNGEVTQLDLDKAREVVGMLQGAIEAAISDELLYRFLTAKIGMAPEPASMALLDFRELRQGSRDIVRPS